MYSAKIYYTKNFHTESQTVDNILKWESDEKGNVKITFRDNTGLQTIERHVGHIEDVHIFKVNPAFF